MIEMARFHRPDTFQDLGPALFHIVFRTDTDSRHMLLRSDNMLHGGAELVRQISVCHQYNANRQFGRLRVHLVSPLPTVFYALFRRVDSFSCGSFLSAAVDIAVQQSDS